MALTIDKIKQYYLPKNASRVNNLQAAQESIAIYNDSVPLYQAIKMVVEDLDLDAASTDLSSTVDATSIVIESSTGDDVTLGSATTSDAGLMSAADKVNHNALITLSGVAAASTHLGTFTGIIIPDNSNIKEALQALEAAIDSNISEYLPTGELSSADSAITISDGEGALYHNVLLNFVPSAVDLSDVGGSLEPSQISTTGAATNNVLIYNGSNWAAGSLAHNNLASLQGGTTNEYYHLTSALHSTLTNSLAARIIGRTSASTGTVQALTATSSVTVSGTNVQLLNDASSPGNTYYYGTNGAGTKGWYALPSLSSAVTAVLDTDDIDLTISTNTLSADLTETGVTAATYGDADTVPVFEVDAKGRIIDVVDTPILITSTQVSNFTEAAQDAVAAALTAGSGVSITYNDASNTITIASSTTYTDEMAQDAVGSILTDSSNIDFTYTDVTPSITADLTATGVTAATYGTAAAVPIINVDAKGRITAAINATINIPTTNVVNFDEAVDDRVATLLVAGTDISLSYNDVANTLTINSTAGGGGSPSGTNYNLQYYNSGAFGADPNITVTPGSSPKLSVGTSTPAATIHAKGPNNTGSPVFLAENASANNILSVLSSGYLQLGDNETLPRFYQTGTVGGSVGYTRGGVTLQGFFDTASTYDIFGVTHTSVTDGSDGPYSVLRLTGTHAPSSGTGEYVGLRINQEINQTGTHSGDAFGIQVVPNLTSIGGQYYGVYVVIEEAGAVGFAQVGADVENFMEGDLDIGGTTSSLHYVGNSGAPSVALGTSARVGSGATASVSGTDAGFEVTLNTGTGISSDGLLFTITFDEPYSAAPVVVASRSHAFHASFPTETYIDSVSATEFSFYTVGNLTSSQTYKWSFIVMGK